MISGQLDGVAFGSPRSQAVVRFPSERGSPVVERNDPQPESDSTASVVLPNGSSFGRFGAQGDLLEHHSFVAAALTKVLYVRQVRLWRTLRGRC